MVNTPDRPAIHGFTHDPAGADPLVAYQPLAVATAVKKADQSVTSNATPADDDTLTLAVERHSYYGIECYLGIYYLSEPGGIQLQFSSPSGATVNVGWTLANAALLGGTSTSAIHELAAIAATTVDGAAPAYARCIGFLTTDEAAGALTLQWAQNSSNGTATTLLAGSWLQLRKLA